MKHPLINAHLQQAFDWRDEGLQAHRKKLLEEDSFARLGSADLIAIRSDLNRQPQGTIGCAVWGPTPGELTAIRQYVIKHMGPGVLYATVDEENMGAIIYDLVVLGVSPDQISIRGETDSDTGTPIVLTTHEALISPHSGLLPFQRQRHCIIDEGHSLFMSIYMKELADLENGMEYDGQGVPLADRIGQKIQEYGFPYAFLIDSTGDLKYGASSLFKIYKVWK